MSSRGAKIKAPTAHNALVLQQNSIVSISDAAMEPIAKVTCNT